MSDPRRAVFGRALAHVKKEYGERVMHRSSSVNIGGIPRYTTGSLSLDVALGGGIPIGMFTLIHGSESSGKTTLAARVAGFAQQTCARCHRPRWDLTVTEEADPETGEVLPVANATCDCVASGLVPPPVRWPGESVADHTARVKAARENGFEEVRVVYVDAEGSFDAGWARRLGLDPDRVYRVQPDSAEQAIDIYTTLAMSGGVDIMILDSIAAMAPTVEIESKAADAQIGVAARMINRFSRETVSAVAANAVKWGRPLTQLWINQEREKIGVAFGNPTVLPGGQQQRFTAAIRIKMWPSKWETEQTSTDLKADWQGKIGKAVRINAKIEKNKTWAALGQGSFLMGVHGDDTGRILDSDYVLAQAERFGLFGAGEKKGTWHLGDETFRTKTEAVARAADPAVAWALREELTRRLLGVA